MVELILTAEKRTETGRKVNALRRSGWLPLVLYGHKVETLNLKVKAMDFDRLFMQAGENTIITVSVDGQSFNCLIQNPDSNPVTGKFTHADLFAVRMDEKVEAEIDLIIEGISPAVKNDGGILIKNITKLPISCLPKDLISSLTINIDGLAKFHDSIHVKDLNLPATIEVMVPGDEVVVTVDEPRSEAELSALNEVVTEDVTQVEGVKKEEPVTPEGEAAADGDKPAKEEKK